jgi:hypothetical protein
MPNVSDIRSDWETNVSSTSVADSELTDSSSKTVWGPGALTGKGLVAFGKGALRSVEYFVIRRRLARIRLRFPHEDDGASDDLDQMYNEILELSRCVLVFVTICCTNTCQAWAIYYPFQDRSIGNHRNTS